MAVRFSPIPLVPRMPAGIFECLVIDIYKTIYTCKSMDLMKTELDNEFSALGFKNQRKNIEVLDQVGKSNIKADSKRKALAPGKRISKTGNIYWETRRNRSDKPGKNI